jgi:hypothetical protein
MVSPPELAVVKPDNQPEQRERAGAQRCIN